MCDHYKNNKFPERYIDSKKCTWHRTKSYEKRKKKRFKNKPRKQAITDYILSSNILTMQDDTLDIDYDCGCGCTCNRSYKYVRPEWDDDHDYDYKTSSNPHVLLAYVFFTPSH